MLLTVEKAKLDPVSTIPPLPIYPSVEAQKNRTLILRR